MIFTQFWAIFRKYFCASHKSERTHILYFSRTNSYFQGDFTKFKENSRTKGTIFKFQEFSRTKVKFKNFSRSVRALFVHFEVEFQKFRILEILNFHPCAESTMILYSSLLVSESSIIYHYANCKVHSNQLH